MKNKIYFLPLIGVLFLMQITFAQKITLPYQEIDGVPVVKVSIDGNAYNFVFDTGAMRTLINSDKIKGLNIIDSLRFKGLFKQSRFVHIVESPNLKIKNTGLDLKNVLYKDLSNLTRFYCKAQVYGILGQDMMEGYIVEIDPKNEVIKFYKKEKFEKEKLKGYEKFRYWTTPLIELKINNKKHFLFFDTGFGAGLYLSGNKLLNYAESHKSIKYYAEGVQALHTRGKDFTGYKMDSINIEMKHKFLSNQILSDQNATLNSVGINNMGFQYIKHFHTYIDQTEKRLYVKPYPHIAEEKYSGLFKYGVTLGFDFDSNQFYVNARTDSNDQLKMGDIVLTINGAALPKEKCGLEAFKKKNYSKEMKMTVLRDGKEKVIAYRVPDKLTARF